MSGLRNAAVRTQSHHVESYGIANGMEIVETETGHLRGAMTNGKEAI